MAELPVTETATNFVTAMALFPIRAAMMTRLEPAAMG